MTIITRYLERGVETLFYNSDYTLLWQRTHGNDTFWFIQCIIKNYLLRNLKSS